MRVMLLHKVTADSEAGILPTLDQTERFPTAGLLLRGETQQHGASAPVSG